MILSTPQEIFGLAIAEQLAASGLALPSMYLGSGLSAQLPQLMDVVAPGASIALICDERTMIAAGKAIQTLRGAGRKITPILLQGKPVADFDALHEIEQGAASADILLAVGSGTINDLCKYASFRLKKPYAVFATAPSMNGYLSANASLSVQGHKTSFAAQLPVAVFCDLDIVSAAPVRMIRSGLGDSLCRCTAQADWLLSHLLMNTPYDARPFNWLRVYEPALIDASRALAQRDPEAIHLLMNTLLLSGLGMSLCGGSYPASQGEHMIAHMAEMAYGSALPQTFHGEQIGVTALSMLRRQEALMEMPPVLLPERAAEIEELTGLLGADTVHEMLGAYHTKMQTAAWAELTDEKLEAQWPKVSAAIKEVLQPYELIEAALKAVGAPLTAHDLGWTQDQFITAVRLARYTRDRFTFMDLT